MAPRVYFETTAFGHSIIPIGQPLVFSRWLHDYHVSCPIML